MPHTVTPVAKRRLAAAAAAASVLVLAACGSSAADGTASGDGDAAASGSDRPESLTFASIPSENATGIAAEYAVVLEAMEGELGIPVELQEATDYAAVIEALRAGQVDVAALGPFSYVTARDGGAGVEPLGAVVDSADEDPGYVSYGVVPAGSDIAELSDFAGRTVCFVDPTSTSGYLYPSAGLLEAGVDPETDVDPVMAGGHDASALSVADGTCEAGFAYDSMVTTSLIESGQLEEGALEVVWESEVIPGSPTVVSTNLPQELQDEITTLFTERMNAPWLAENGYCASEDDCVLPEEHTYGYVPVEDELYDGIREVCDITGSASCVEGE
ncbi:phosphate/phosphite/phosphonate ABC transporter substrate-binding protein [Georgenia deserti]|uniref:Phosphate/phosphite/phosphonate ABC transporter substrate-binding protein n=1 Tax=Georgenia deserti TaxID=2093781 RepID=A0ABW4L7Y0_9MICO